MTTDCIHVNGIRAYGYVGVLPEEQSIGQWFQVDLTLWRDLSQAAQSDRLSDTYDYTSVVKDVQQVIKTAKFALLERLAGAIADIAFCAGEVDRVRVRLTKLSPPIPDFSGTISVEIIRPAPGDS